MKFSTTQQVKQLLLRHILDGQFPEQKPLPTIRLLAKTLGVSIPTAHKAVNLLCKDGILRAKNRRGVFINTVAHRTSGTDKVGLVHLYPASVRVGMPWPVKVLKALTQRLKSLRFECVEIPLLGVEKLNLEHCFKRHSLRGLILFEMQTDLFISECQALLLPMVSIDHNAFHLGVSSVVFDNAFGTFQATQRLLRRGHRRIAFLRPLVKTQLWGRVLLDQTESERQLGYEMAMKDAELQPWVVEYEDSLIQKEGVALAEKILKDLGAAGAFPTALVFPNDPSAMLFARAALGLGLRIPEDLSVVGFGDVGTEFAPGRRISSVRIADVEMGQAAADLFAALISGKLPRPVLKTIRTQGAPHESDGAPRPPRTRLVLGSPHAPREEPVARFTVAASSRGA